MTFKGLTALALVLAAAAGPAFAQDKSEGKGNDAPAEKVVPQVHSTRLSGVFGGQKVNYTATIGETILAAVKTGLRIEEVPVTISRRHSGLSKKPGAVRYGWGFMRAIWKTWWR